MSVFCPRKVRIKSVALYSIESLIFEKPLLTALLNVVEIGEHGTVCCLVHLECVH